MAKLPSDLLPVHQKRNVTPPAPLPPPQATPDQFLIALFGQAGDLFVELRGRKTSGQIRQEWFKTNLTGYAELLRTAEQWNAEDFNIYFGVHPRHSRGGTAAHVAEYRTVFVDLDAGDGKEYPDADYALDQLEYAVDALTVVPPSSVFFSGNGVHAYWLLDKPIPVDQTLRYKGIMRALADLLDADQAVGAGDPPRVMRLPGFDNVKDPTDPKETSLETLQTELRYPVEMLPLSGVRASSDAYTGNVELPSEVSGDLRRICEALGDAGHRYRIKETLDRKVNAVVLSGVCPVCKGGPEKYSRPKEGTAHISAVALRLKCKREGCGAAEHTGGIPTAAWMPLMGLAPLYASPQAPTVELADVPAEFKSAFDYCADAWTAGRAGVVALPPGAGKTREAMAVLADQVNAGAGAVLAVPSNALVEEKAGELREHFPGLPVVAAVSMARGCKRFPRLREWQRYYKNLPAHACERGCVHRTQCPAFTWRDQYRAHNGRCVLVCTHHLLDKLPAPSPALIVVDEFPGMIAQHRTWNAADVENVANPRRMVGDTPWYYHRRAAAKLLSRVLAYCTENRLELLEKHKGKGQTNYGFALHGDELHKATVRAAASMDLDPAQVFNYSRDGELPFPAPADLQAETAEFNHYAPLDFDDLVDGFEDCAVWVPGNRDNAELSATHYRLLSHCNLDTPAGVPVVFMDATGAQTAPMLSRAIARKVDVLEREIPTPHVKTCWWQTDTYTARRIAHDRKRVERAATLDLLEAIQETGDDLDQIAYGIITTKAFKTDVWPEIPGNVKTACGDFPYLTPLHYGATVGTNELENVNVLVLFGAPTPNIGVTDYEAWRYGLAGDDYRQRLERAELAQAIGRARGVRRTTSNPLTVYVVGHHPPPGADVEIRQRQKGRRRDELSLALLDVFDGIVDAYGFISPSMLTGNGELSRLSAEFRQNWQEKHSLSCHIRRDPETTGAVLAEQLHSRAERLLRQYAKDRGWTRRRVTNPEATAAVVLYEATPGAYEVWRDRPDAEPVPTHAVALPVVAVDLRLLLELPDVDDQEHTRPPPLAWAEPG